MYRRESFSIDEQAEAIKKFSEDLCRQGVEACREFLVSTGVYNKDGTLTDNYK